MTGMMEGGGLDCSMACCRSLRPSSGSGLPSPGPSQCSSSCRSIMPSAADMIGSGAVERLLEGLFSAA